MKKPLFYFLFFVNLFWIQGCKKDSSYQPIVPGGLFSAVIDSVVFSSDKYSLDPVTGQYLGNYASIVGGSTPQLSITGQKNNPRDSTYTSINFFTAKVAVGSYSTTLTDSGFCELIYTHGPVSRDTIWNTNATHSGTVTITKLDMSNKVVSGTFSFTAFTTGALPDVHVTNGSFTDVPIKP
ncbi:MAG: hypothetical protein JWO06_806 [Bacteroidota bacterium]|nr:hypothetical protein [Bacteroidota bacterium]